MKKKPNRIIEAITGFLPVTRRAYKEDLKNLLIIIKGIKQAEVQHTQMEANLSKAVGNMQMAKSQSTRKDDDIAFG